MRAQPGHGLRKLKRIAFTVLVLLINFAVYLFIKKKRQDLTQVKRIEKSQMEEAFSQADESTVDTDHEPMTRTPRKLEEAEDRFENSELKHLRNNALFIIDEEEISLEMEESDRNYTR